jgi:EmrB/QacA subfamily drug resistance transporter
MSTPTPEQQHERPEHPYPDRWRALAVTLLVGYMTLLDITIVNVAVPSIQSGLGASAQAVQWIVSGYALTFGLTLVAGGRLGDLVGRRRMFLVGLVGFTITSALAGAAPDAHLMVAARLLQGAAAGFLTPQNTGLIQQLFTGAERGKAFGIFGTTVGASAASGPVLGGLLIALFGTQDGWRYVFFVNVPIGLVAMLLAVRLLPRAAPRAGSLGRQVDPVGAVLLGLAVLCVLLPVIEAQTTLATGIWWLVAAAPVPAVAFAAWERRLVRRAASPLLDVRLFTRAPGFTSGILLGTIYFCGFSGIWLVLALFFQQGLGYSPLQSGLSVMPFAIGSSISSVLAGRMVARWGRWVTVLGLLLVIAGFAALAILVPLTLPDHAALVTLAPLFVAGVGSGSVISPNITMTLEQVPPVMGGAAGGALQTGQRIGSAIGAAVVTAAFRLTLDARGLGSAVSVTFAASMVFTVAALAMAVRELRTRGTADPVSAEPSGERRARAPSG